LTLEFPILGRGPGCPPHQPDDPDQQDSANERDRPRHRGRHNLLSARIYAAPATQLQKLCSFPRYDWHLIRIQGIKVRHLPPCKRMCAKGHKRRSTDNYSITSSALAIRVSGTVTPIALAVFRFTMSSNFTARSMGKFVGGVPFRILSTKVAER
jgi:hypothetical protein